MGQGRTHDITTQVILLRRSCGGGECPLAGPKRRRTNLGDAERRLPRYHAQDDVAVYGLASREDTARQGRGRPRAVGELGGVDAGRLGWIASRGA